MSTLLRSWYAKSAVVLLLSGSGTNVRAQVLRERDLGLDPNDDFGSSCANVGDVDGDGVDDFIVGSFGYDVGALADAGRVVVYSGRTGALIRSHDGAAAGDYLGFSVAGAGDVDGDGVPDYVVSAPYKTTTAASAGFVVVYSGSSGATIWTRDGATALGFLGYSVSGVGDVDGDGKGEVVVGTINDEVFVIDHLGQDVHHLTGSHGYGFGYTVTGCGDLDHDGVNDFAVASPHAGFLTYTDLGAVIAFSGATGVFLHTTFGNNTGDQLGRTLAKLGDVDGDGVADYIAGSPYAGAPGADVGVIQVISGASGYMIREQTGDTNVEYHGVSVTGMGDVDRDGVPDYAVGAREAGSGHEGRVRICSGRDGGTIYEWYGVAGVNTDLGASVASGDWNRDGVADLLSGDYGFENAGASVGAIDVQLMAPAWSENYGAGWPGLNGIPGLTAVQVPAVGAPFDLQLGNSLGADTVALLFVGMQTANIAFSQSGTLLVAPLFTIVLPVPAAGLTLNGAIPNDPALYFMDVYLQALELDANASRGLSFTPGLQLHCGFDLP